MPGISDLLDSDMENDDFVDENSIISSVSDASDTGAGLGKDAATRKPKRRHRVTMPKIKPRVAKSPPTGTTKKLPKKPGATKRKAVDDAVTLEVVTDSQTNDVEDSEQMEEVTAGESTRPKHASKKPTRKVKTATNHSDDVGIEIKQTPALAQSKQVQTMTSKTAPKAVRTSKTSSSQRPQEELEVVKQIESATALPDLLEVDEIVAEQPPAKRARTESKNRQELHYRRRAGSASDTERGDPILRRKLGDITRKFENIDVKYKTLRDVGVVEANANVEKLRKQCEATTEASNNLISSLKKELTQQAPLVQDAHKLKKELHARNEEMAKLRASQAELSASLGAAHNEIKALQAKLAAARTASASAEPQTNKPPGSAIKAGRLAVTANSDAIQTAQLTQMKLDLYGDLTGLIVRSVKRAEDGDTYDCIQTGRNGTLHFKLFIDQEDARSASFEDTEFLYTPLLDADRDRDMIELMPPYLTEDITFARQNAAKFYQRVVDTLTRRTNEG